MKKIIIISLLSFVVSYAQICSEHEAAQDKGQLREFCTRICEMEDELKALEQSEASFEQPNVTTETLQIIEPEALPEPVPSIPQDELTKEVNKDLGDEDIALIVETPVIGSIDFIPEDATSEESEDAIEIELEDDDDESMQ